MYRIALQLTPATPTKPATFQYLTSAGSTPWEAETKQEGLEKYTKELDNYKRSVISLVKIVDVDIEAKDADPSCEYDLDGDGIHDDIQAEEPAESEAPVEPEPSEPEETEPSEPEETE